MGFKENLKAALGDSGMRVKELSALSGIKMQTLHSYLSTHDNIPSAENAVAIARALGVSVEFLVTGVENQGMNGTILPSRHQDARLIANIATGLNEKNRKMAIAIIKTMKKQENLEK
jgi:transcriptional regulator with XRE-family HTH domain